jgi:histidyl-tRNA synthetase
VYETHLVEHPEIGSICSGGRYENLAGNYTKSHLPGVGISIGATRLFWQLREAGLIEAADNSVKALVAVMDESHLAACLELAGELRGAGIATEVALEGGKLARQFRYADRAGIPFVLVLGADEIANGVVTLKDLRAQQQSAVPRARIVETIATALGRSPATDKPDGFPLSRE